MTNLSVRRFTLLEVLVVIAISALALGLFGMQARRAWTRQQIKTSVNLVRSRLELAEKLSLSTRSNVTVHLGKICSLSIEERFFPTIEKLAGRPTPLNAIETISPEVLTITPQHSWEVVTLHSILGTEITLTNPHTTYETAPPYPTEEIASLSAS